MEPGSERDREWLGEQLSETERLISDLRAQPKTPKQQLALEALARVQLRILQALAAGEPPSEN